jgi:transposase-like protein
MGGMKKQTEAKWRQLLQDQARSGLSVREFAERRGMSAATLYWWRTKLRDSRDGGSQLVPVEIVAPLRSSSAIFELQIGEALTVRVQPGFAESDLRRLLAVLKASC